MPVFVVAAHQIVRCNLLSKAPKTRLVMCCLLIINQFCLDQIAASQAFGLVEYSDVISFSVLINFFLNDFCRGVGRDGVPVVVVSETLGYTHPLQAVWIFKLRKFFH